MPPRDPTRTQLDNPALVADLISQLQIIGAVGLLDFLPSVSPVFIVGSRGLTILAETPVYAPAEIFDGNALDPAANNVLVDTGQLPAGDYDLNLMWNFNITASTGTGAFALQHRNAANAVTLSTWSLADNGAGDRIVSFSIALLLAENERLRLLNDNALTGRVMGTIAIKRRPTP